MRVEPVRVQTLENRVYVRIKDMIVTLHLRPGESLNISVLAATLEVSITPVRAALQLLERENLVQRIPNIGFSVAELTETDAEYVYEMRRSLEMLALERAILNIDRGKLVSLIIAMKEMKAHFKEMQLRVQPFTLDYSLHDLILSSCENPYLLNTYVGLMANIQRYRNLIWQAELPDDEAWIESELEEHIRIGEYMLDGDLGNASKTMNAHINKLIEVVKKKLADVRLASESGKE